MRYELHLTAFDMLEHVNVAWYLEATDPNGPPLPQRVLAGVSLLRGCGEDEPSEWVRDALVQVLEDL